MWSHGHFYWNELMTRDVEGAKAFYEGTIGWTFEAMPMPDGTYWIIKAGDKPAEDRLINAKAARLGEGHRRAGPARVL